MRTTTERPLRLLVTITRVPNGSLRCAAVSLDGFMRSPEAVFEVSAYQDAPPHWRAWAGIAAPAASMANAATAAIIVNLDCISFHSFLLQCKTGAACGYEMRQQCGLLRRNRLRMVAIVMFGEECV
jgi:hypothetical protein